MNEFEGRFTNWSFAASCRLTSNDLFTQASVSLTGMLSISFVSSLNGPLSVLGFVPFAAFLFGFGELWRELVLVAKRLCLTPRLIGVS